MVGNGKKGPIMQHSKGARTIGRVGVCLAFVSSVLVFAGPASAAENVTMAYEYSHEQFTVNLTGDEVRDGGDREGYGVARLDFDEENERVCYVITWQRLEGDVTAFHLHQAPREHDGGHAIDFFNNQHFDGDRHTVASCVHSDRGQIREILEEPRDYYLMLHTTEHDAGAIRGQLA